MSTHHLQPHKCPWCGELLDAADDLPAQVEQMPSSGDVTMCLCCGEWCVFEADLALRKPTDAEFLDLGEDVRCRRLRKAWTHMNQTRTKS